MSEARPPAAAGAPSAPPRAEGGGTHARRGGLSYAAIDLGTNNCRLLVAKPTRDGFQVVDSYSRIVRLGEGVSDTGALSDAAMERAVEALKACAEKVGRHRVAGLRGVATHACRGASNGAEFLDRVRRETGLALELIAPDEEARLAVLGCLNLIDPKAEAVLVVDIGGGSTELSWVDAKAARAGRGAGALLAWTSTPIGVVSLAERFPERADDRCAWYEDMRAFATAQFVDPPGVDRLREAFVAGRAHIIGTSGTVTSLAGVHMGLPRYERSKVDGAWVTLQEALSASARLQAMCAQERAAEPCIGKERADLVLAGCAILEAVTSAWPSARVRVADRGLREGLLLTLMGRGQAKRRRGRRRRKTGRKATHGSSS